MYKLLSEIKDTPGAARRWMPNMMLASVTVYMMNAVMYRPSERPAEQELAKACAYWYDPNADPEDEENAGAEVDEDNMVPCLEPRGVYFICAIVRDRGGGYLRLPADRTIDPFQLGLMYGQTGGFPAAQQAVSGMALGLSRLSRSNRERTNNRRPTQEVTLLQEPVLHDFGLQDRGVRRQRRLQMTGDDVDNLGGFEDLEPERPLDGVFSKIWAQFPSDIIQCAPNFRSRLAPSRLTMSLAERQAANEEVFKSVTALPFQAAYIRILSEDEWKDMMFPRYYPPKGKPIAPNLQNFRNAQYFRDYLAELDSLTTRSSNIVRLLLKEKFLGLLWVPHASTDRMWDTKARHNTNGWLRYPEDLTGPAVNIAVNRRLLDSVRDIALYDPEDLAQQVRNEREVLEEEDQAWLAQQARANHRESVAPPQVLGPRRSLTRSIRTPHSPIPRHSPRGSPPINSPRLPGPQQEEEEEEEEPDSPRRSPPINSPPRLPGPQQEEEEEEEEEEHPQQPRPDPWLMAMAQVEDCRAAVQRFIEEGEAADAAAARNLREEEEEDEEDPPIEQPRFESDHLSARGGWQPRTPQQHRRSDSLLGLESPTNPFVDSPNNAPVRSPTTSPFDSPTNPFRDLDLSRPATPAPHTPIRQYRFMLELPRPPTPPTPTVSRLLPISGPRPAPPPFPDLRDFMDWDVQHTL